MKDIDAARIAGLPVFSGASPAQIEAILAEARQTAYPKRHPIFRQGDRAESFWLLLEGRLRAIKLTPEGEQVIVRHVGPGELFGIAVAMGRPVYPATAMPLVDSHALVWPSSAWHRLVERCPPFATAALHAVGDRLSDAHAQVVEMSTQSVERRIAHALLRLAGQAGRPLPSGTEIDMPLSRQDIAEMTGTTLHTVSRILSAWEARGLVGGGRRRIHILDAERLTALASGETTQPDGPESARR
ncbi:Crp/Fnr family transcriptional regulator [Enterovirga rhinocerotis]|uniref:Crp/Fnr family transcriptional regulator n=1 Tax=Enterovirga rhinocerotis TaxID=1339210 RepID=A0A4R7CBE1_9HYPH|nr:Crp/Fnr family transcriptional regulator [Enterovirga rhinocerotis]TDR94077.1 Crp/Fnr family transcriptional regulator [Enterovirga rhinocerotis]